MSYLVSTSAINDYKSIFFDNLVQTINELVNQKFTINNNYYKQSLLFFDEFLVCIYIAEDKITGLQQYDYDHFIPDYFVDEVAKMSNLPPRLNRYKSLGRERFREEIKTSLIQSKIISLQGIAVWKDYGIQMQINKDNLQLAHIIN